MPIPFAELLNRSRPIDSDYQGKTAAVREFLVYTQQTAAARAEPTLPQRNDQHPDFPDLVVDRVSFSPTGNGHVSAVAYYSNDRRFASGDGPTLDNTPSILRWGWEETDVVVNIPVNVRVSVVTSNGEARIVTRAWESQTIKVPETWIIRPYRTLVKVTSVTELDAIAEQKRVIHTIGGRKYQYLGAGVQQRSDVDFLVEHRWLYDKGTPMPYPDAYFDQGTGEQTFQIHFPENSTDPNLVRSPYAVLKSLASTNPETAIHKTINVFPFREDPDGWRRLPGVII